MLSKLVISFFFNFGLDGYKKIYSICPKIFLDLKLHDIPNTVAKGLEALIKMKPNHLEDIIALVALYRPGPMSNIPTYNDCKHGKQKPDYLHPLLEEILKPTYGVIIYQEHKYLFFYLRPATQVSYHSNH